MNTEVLHMNHYVTHAITIPEEDVEARLLIPGGWCSKSPEYVMLVIRHDKYITVGKLVEGNIGLSLINVVDSYYPMKQGLKKKKLYAETAYTDIIEALTVKPFTTNQGISHVTVAFRNRFSFIRERESAFADLTMDFSIMGPILEYCEKAIATFKRVTGEVTSYGCGDSDTDENTSRQQPGPGDVDQNRGEDQEE